MKKNLLSLLLLIAAVLSVGFTSCNKNDNDDNLGKEDPPIVKPSDDPFMEVCQHVVEVAKSVDVYYDKCHSMEELNKHLEDIKKIDNVEDVYSTDNTMFIEIKDYGKIAYSFFKRPETYEIDPNIVYPLTRSKASANYSTHSYLNPKSVCIANAQFLEDNKVDRRIVANALKKLCDNYGYQTILINAPNLHFYSETIFKYDIVLLITHGSYDTKSNVHWLIGSELPEAKHLTQLDEDNLYKYKDYPRDEVILVKCNYTDENGTPYSDADNVATWRLKVSEKFIKNAANRISSEKEGKPIFFNVACQSLKENDNMGKTFLDKGFGAYYGYDESNYYGQRAYFYMLNKLLSGMSLENAYNTLPDDYRKETKDPYAKLLKMYNTQKNPDIGESCITKPYINKPTDLCTDDRIWFNLSGKAIFLSYYLTKDYEGEWMFKQDPTFSYGFFISETANLKDAYQVCYITSGDTSHFSEDKSTGLVSFNYTLMYKQGSLNNIIIPEKKYYVWSYIYDGLDFYFSDMETFTTPSLRESNNSGEGELPDVPGTDL